MSGLPLPVTEAGTWGARGAVGGVGAVGPQVPVVWRGGRAAAFAGL